MRSSTVLFTVHTSFKKLLTLFDKVRLFEAASAASGPVRAQITQTAFLERMTSEIQNLPMSFVFKM